MKKPVQIALLLLGSTILLSHLLFLSDFSPALRLLRQYRVPYLVDWSVRYLLPAAIVAILFQFARLPKRLPNRINGRYLLGAGVLMFIVAFGADQAILRIYRPGIGTLLAVVYQSLPYARENSLLLIFAGFSRALLCAAPSKLSPTDPSATRRA